MNRTWLVVCFCFAPAFGQDVEKLAWMAGCWETQLGTVTIFEQWTRPGGGTLLGAGRTVKGGKTVFHEFLRIAVEQGQLVYTARIGTKGVTGFPLKQMTPGEVVFENPEHDFPQRIIYRKNGGGYRKNGGGMTARIEGVDKGKARHEEFPYVRVACE